MDICVAWKKKKNRYQFKVRHKTSAENCHMDIIFPLAEFFCKNVSSKVQRNRQLRTYRSNKKPTFCGTHRTDTERAAVKFRAPPPRKAVKLLQTYLYEPSEYPRAYVRPNVIIWGMNAPWKSINIEMVPSPRAHSTRVHEINRSDEQYARAIRYNDIIMEISLRPWLTSHEK